MAIPIDYQVGDVIAPISENFRNIKAIVTDITEKGVNVRFIKSEVEMFIKNSDMHLFMKDKTGTLLHGDQGRKYSKSERY